MLSVIIVLVATIAFMNARHPPSTGVMTNMLLIRINASNAAPVRVFVIFQRLTARANAPIKTVTLLRGEIEWRLIL
jgi:hypothetical protein